MCGSGFRGRYGSFAAVAVALGGCNMDFELVLKAAGVGIIITVVCQIMSKAGRDEQSTLVSLVGMVVIFILLADRLGELIATLRSVFLL